jgi:hypothetical protein
MWVQEPQLELTPQPLIDGRYVLTRRTLSCAGDFVPPADPQRVQGMVEVSGCVLRITFIGAQGSEPQVTVATFNDASDGMLELMDACSAGPPELMPTAYGFDGTTLQLPVSVELSGADGSAHASGGFYTYQL